MRGRVPDPARGRGRCVCRTSREPRELLPGAEAQARGEAAPASDTCLSDEERARVLALLDSEPYMDMAPAKVYAKLLEDGEYLCSTRTMHRVLAQNEQARERRAHRPRT